MVIGMVAQDIPGTGIGDHTEALVIITATDVTAEDATEDMDIEDGSLVCR